MNPTSSSERLIKACPNSGLSEKQAMLLKDSSFNVTRDGMSWMWKKLIKNQILVKESIHTFKIGIYKSTPALALIDNVRSLVKYGSMTAWGACNVTPPIAVSDSMVIGREHMSSSIKLLSSSFPSNFKVVRVVKVGNSVANASDSSADWTQGRSLSASRRRWCNWRREIKYSSAIEDMDSTCRLCTEDKKHP